MANNNVNTREDIARLLDEDPREIQIFKPSKEWALRQGIIVKLHISRWRGIVSLTWDDLGLVLPEEDRETMEQRLSLGHKYLLPKEILKQFSSIEYQARANLARYSFRTHWGYFVPVTSYPIFKESNREYQRQYLQLADEVCLEWDSISEKVIDGHAEDAQIAWQTARKLDMDSLEDEQLDELDAFTRQYVQRLIKDRPTSEEFRRSCNYEMELFFIPLPGFWEQEQDYALQLREEASITVALANAQAEMEQDVLRQVKEDKEQLIEGFYRDVLAQLMLMVDRIMWDVRASLERNEYIPSKTAEKLSVLIDSVRQLDFLGIAQIEEAIKPVEDLLAQEDEELEEKEITSMKSHADEVISRFRDTLDRWGIQSPRLEKQKRAREKEMEIEMPGGGKKRHRKGEMEPGDMPAKRARGRASDREAPPTDQGVDELEGEREAI